MKVLKIVLRIATGAMVVQYASLALAQTCVSGIQASNPTSVYFVNSVIGTVIDSRTGLMWDRCALGQSGPACATGSASAINWQSALDATAALGTYKGYNDWRLPNYKELHSLIEECRVVASINEFAFPNTPALNFWSGSPSVSDVQSSWFISFNDGSSYFANRSNVGRVRLVRAGQ